MFGPVFLKLREARRDEAFHTITDFTLLNVLSRIKLQITGVIFPNASREIRRITKQDMSPKRSADNITRSYFRHYNLHRIFVELLFSKPSKNSVSLTILLSCNFKGLDFDFCLNRKRNEISVGWRRIVATYLHIS